MFFLENKHFTLFFNFHFLSLFSWVVNFPWAKKKHTQNKVHRDKMKRLDYDKMDRCVKYYNEEKCSYLSKHAVNK